VRLFVRKEEDEPGVKGERKVTPRGKTIKSKITFKAF
jgi:hypothetical protein